MFTLKHLKVLTSKARLKALLSIVIVFAMLVLMIPADIGAFFVGAATTEWDGSLQPFANYSDSYSQFANGETAYEIANAKQLAFLAAILNVKPSYKSGKGYSVALDVTGDGVDETYYFPGTGTTTAKILNNAKFVLTNDIDLGGLQWAPIGSASYPFSATFDGQGHSITGLSYIDETTPNASSSGIGLFGKTGTTATIRNVHVNGTIKTYQTNMGGIVGYVTGNLEMENCSFAGTVQGGAANYLANIGGLIGYAASSGKVTIKNCFVHGDGTAITGAMMPGDTNIAHSPEAVGGLVGCVIFGCDLTITDSYAECTVSGSDGSGGLVGTIHSNENFTTVLIERSYSAGSMVSASRVGGLVGWVRDTLNTEANPETNTSEKITKLDLTIKDSYSVMDFTNATHSTRACGLVSCSRPTQVEPEDVTISLIGCHFAGINAKQPVMDYDAAYSTLKTVERIYYRAGSNTIKAHTLQLHSGVEEKSRKAFMDGRVTALLNADRDVWATSMWADYPVFGQDEKPTLSTLTVNGESIPVFGKALEYTAKNEVADTTGAVLVSATAAQEGATVTVNGADENGYVALGIPGTSTAITITVTYNDVLSTTYTVNVYRKPTPWDGTFEVFENYEVDAGTYDHYAEYTKGGKRVYEIANAKQLAFLMQIAAIPEKYTVSGTSTKENTGLKTNMGNSINSKRRYEVLYDVDGDGENETYQFAGSAMGFLREVNFKLIADIDLGGAGENRQNWYKAFTTTGTSSVGTFSSTLPVTFYGEFDGNGHSVKNLYLEKAYTDYLGLFSKVTYGTVKDLTVYGDVMGEDYVGGIVGRIAGGADLINCAFSGTVSGTTCVGGIAGATEAYSGTSTGCDFILTNCWTDGTLLARGSGTTTTLSGIGGLIGHSAYNKSYDSAVTANQTGDGGNLTLNKCYSTMAIKPRSDAQTSVKNGLGVGGLVGQSSAAFGSSNYSTPGKVIYNNCYFAGSVKSNPFGTEELAADGTSKVTVQNGLYYKTDSVADATPSGVVGVGKIAEDFVDGVVAKELNSHLETPEWATSVSGHPVLSNLATEEFDGAIGVIGTSIRTEGIQALRYKFSISDEVIELEELHKVGILAAKASEKIVGERLYAHNLPTNASNYYKYADAVAYTKGGDMLALIDDGTKFLFTAALHNLTEAKYGIDYIARAYATFIDAKGQEIIIYGETIGDEYFNSIDDVVDGFINYPNSTNISMNDLLVLKDIFNNRYEEVLPEDVGLEVDERSGGDIITQYGEKDELPAGGFNAVEDSTYLAGGGAENEAAALRNEILNTPNTFTDDQIEAITKRGNTVYYISPSGNDKNDGKSPKTAWRNVDAINLHNNQIQAGDAVLFERGGIYRSVASLLAEPIPEGVKTTTPQMIVYTKSGVTYGAYGEGAKPAIYSCHKNYAWGDCWERLSEDSNIWKVYTPRSDAGFVVFDHGKRVGIKRWGIWDGKSYNSDGKKVYNGFITPENVEENLTENYEYYHDHRNGVLYLYLEGDKAPNELFSDIEIGPRDGVFKAVARTEDVHVDNLAIKYTGYYGVSAAEYTKGITVTNCEMGWIGGCQWHFDTEAEGSRIGNAIEFWETTTDATTNHNWIYQVYDAGLSPQGTSTDNQSVYKNLKMCNNLVEYCSYGIEWFDRNGVDQNKNNPAVWDGYYMEDNIFRFSGYGFGRQRQDSNAAPSNICGWTWIYPDTETKLALTFKNNIFDCSAKYSIYWYWSNQNFQPVTYTDDEAFENSEEMKKMLIYGNTFYESDAKGIRYGTGTSSQPAITSTETLLEAIKKFDPIPKKVEWLGTPTSSN